MSRRSKLLSLAALVALMAAAGILLTEGERAALPAVPGAAPPAAAPTVEDAHADAGAQADAAARAAVEPGAAVADLPPELDPVYRAGLAGFQGRVLHHDGAPAADTRVLLYRADAAAIAGEIGDLLSSQTIAPAIDAGEATTGADGRFAIHGVWPRGMYLLHAGVGSGNATPKIVERTPAAGEIVDLGDIRLRDGAVLTGTVLDEAGQPVAGALVRVVDLPAQLLQIAGIERFDPEGAIVVSEERHQMVIPMPAWAKERFEQLPIASARTAADGTFRVTGIAPGDNVLIVNAPDLRPLTLPNLKLEAGEEKHAGTLRIRAGEEVYGRVVDAAGRPVPNADVLVAQGGAMSQVAFAGPAVRTDAKGAFSARGFAGGLVVGAARRGPGEPWIVSGAQPALRDLELVLPAALRLTLQITGPDGAAVEDVKLRLLPGVPGDGALELATLGLADEIDLRPRLELLEDGRYRIADLAPGRYTLLARAAGHALAGRRIELTADLVETVELEPEATLAVRVQDSEGTPVRAAQIWVEARSRDGRRLRDLPVPVGRTDARGQLSAGGLPPGQLRLAARHPAWGTVSAEAQVPGGAVVLTFAAPGAIEGVLTDGGQVPEPAKWTISVMPQGTGRTPLPQMPRMTVPDAEGAFALRGLQPGDYRLEVIESLARIASPGALARAMMQGRLYDPNLPVVTVVAGETAHVTVDAQRKASVDGPSARITGTVLVDGAPATGMALSGWSNSGRVSAVVDAAGRFDLGQIGEGQAYLQLTDPEAGMMMRSSLWSRGIQVVANQDQTIDIALTTASLSGRVVDTTGAAVGGAQVRLSGSLQGNAGVSASSSFRAVTDDRGRFDVPRIPAGKYRVSAEHEQAGVGTAAVELTSGLREVDVRLEPTAVVSGRVDLTSLGNPRDVWLSFSPATPKGGPLSSEGTRVERDGRFETRKLIPGDYHVQAHAFFEGEPNGKPFDLEGTLRIEGLRAENLVLQFKPREHKR